MKYREKRVAQSFSLSIKQLECLIAIAQKEGGSLSAHVGLAVDDYLVKKGYSKLEEREYHV